MKSAARLRARRAQAAGAALAWAPLAYDALEHAAPFASPRCAEGVVAVAGASLRIFVCDAATQGEFTQAVVPLRYTPRRLCALPPAGAAPRVLVVEADQHRYNEAERRVSSAEGAALAAEYEVKFLETSAKHDINVSETFTAIAREVVARIPAEGAASTRGATRLSGTSGKKKSSCCG